MNIRKTSFRERPSEQRIPLASRYRGTVFRQGAPWNVSSDETYNEVPKTGLDKTGQALRENRGTPPPKLQAKCPSLLRRIRDRKEARQCCNQRQFLKNLGKTRPSRKVFFRL